MAHENQDDGLIRRYLLSQLAEGELEQIEERMMADNELFERVLLAEDELVEEYVLGELPESDGAEFEASFLSTPKGRQQVSLARALREKPLRDYVKPSLDQQREGAPEEKPESSNGAPNNPKTFTTVATGGGTIAEEPVSPAPPRASDASRPSWWRLPAFRLAAAAVVVIGLVLGLYPVIKPPSYLSQGLAALNEAYHQQRPIEPRISGFAYAPVSVTRGDASKRVDARSLNRAERILLDEVADHPSAASRHALGRLYLAEQKVDEAIKEFDEALKTEPNNAQLHSDYGAALLEKGKAERRDDESSNPEEFAQSLKHLNDAIALDNSLVEALFNRALCYQELKLFSEAERDWRAYLQKDGSSKWADEARNNLRLLSGKIQSSQDKEKLWMRFCPRPTGDAIRTSDAIAVSSFRQGTMTQHRPSQS